MRTLDGLGYDVEWQVLNSKDYVPQSRERVYIIGHLRGSGTEQVFPIRREDENISGLEGNSLGIQSLGNINPSGKGFSGKVYHSAALSPTLMAGSEVKIAVPKESSKNGLILAGNLEGTFMQGNRVYSEEGCAPTLTTKGDALKILVIEATKKGYREVKPGEEQAVVTDAYEIRKLTARECWRLQGFPDWAYNKAAEVNSEY